MCSLFVMQVKISSTVSVQFSGIFDIQAIHTGRGE